MFYLLIPCICLPELFSGNNIFNILFEEVGKENDKMSDSKTLTILQMNDLHAYIDLHMEMFLEKGKATYRPAGRLARIATLFQSIRKQYPHQVLALDNGDTFHGTFPAVQSKGEALVPMINALHFDAMTAHWEFAYGPKHFEHLASQLQHPMLAINVYDELTNERIFPPYSIVKRADLKIGIIGIAEHIVDKTMPSHFSEGIYFTMGNEELPTIIHQLRHEENVDLIVLLSHFGFPQEVKLAQEVDGIDILLSGHTHNRMAKPVVVNDTIIFQSGCHGAFIGRLDIEVEHDKIKHFTHELIEVAETIIPDPPMQKRIDDTIRPNKTKLNEIIGHTEVPLHRYAQLETTMDNLLLASLLHATKADVAFSNGWRYGAPVATGPITMNDLWNIIPTNPPVSTVNLRGREIINMMEASLEAVFAADPYNQMGGYVKRCLGMTLFVKLENPPGTRIQVAFIQGKEIEPDETYHAAFVTVQGVPKMYETDRHNLSLHAIDALRQYIEKHEVVAPILQGTIQVV